MSSLRMVAQGYANLDEERAHVDELFGLPATLLVLTSEKSMFRYQRVPVP
jgi:hypothetical protein